MMEKENRKMTFTIRETAEALGLTEKAVYSLVFRRRIPFLKVGRKVLIPVERLKDFLDSKVIRPIAENGKQKGE